MGDGQYLTAPLIAKVDPIDTNKLDTKIFQLAGFLAESTCADSRRGVLDSEIDGGHGRCRGGWNNGTVELVVVVSIRWSNCYETLTCSVSIMVTVFTQ